MDWGGWSETRSGRCAWAGGTTNATLAVQTEAMGRASGEIVAHGSLRQSLKGNPKCLLDRHIAPRHPSPSCAGRTHFGAVGAPAKSDYFEPAMSGGQRELRGPARRIAIRWRPSACSSPAPERKGGFSCESL